VKCHSCKGTIAAGAEAQKMAIEYTQPDGAVKVYGYQMPGGPLVNATGVLLRAWHHKCWHVTRKREARGDARTGRVLGEGALPSSYELAARRAPHLLPTVEGPLLLSEDDLTGERSADAILVERVEELRQVAREVGKPIGDPEVIEAFRAKRHGGPYPHSHQMPLEVYQLLAHVRYAHGYYGDDVIARGAQNVHAMLHAEMQAQQALRAAVDVRADDPGHESGVADRPDTDWREQHAIDL